MKLYALTNNQEACLLAPSDVDVAKLAVDVPESPSVSGADASMVMPVMLSDAVVFSTLKLEPGLKTPGMTEG